MASSEPSPQQVPPPVALHRLMSGHWIAQAIFVAAQLGVADYLTGGVSDAACDGGFSADAHRANPYPLKCHRGSACRGREARGSRVTFAPDPGGAGTT